MSKKATEEVEDPFFVDPDEPETEETEITNEADEAEEVEEVETTEEDPEKGEADQKGESEEAEEAEEKTVTMSQADLDTIISNRLKAQDAKHQRELALERESKEQILTTANQNSQTQQELARKAVDDGLIEGSDDLAKIHQLKQDAPSKAYAIDPGIDANAMKGAINRLTISAYKAGLSEHLIKAYDAELGSMVTNDFVPLDLMIEASNHPKSFQLIEEMINNPSFKDKVVNAGLKAKQTGNVDDFRLEFNSIADSLVETKDEPTVKQDAADDKATRKRITPAKRENLKPTGADGPTDEVEIPVAEW